MRGRNTMEHKKFEEIYHYGERLAVITRQECLTYKELADICDRVGTLLEGRQLIFHICSHSLGSIAGYVAFYNNNQVQLLLNEDIEDDVLNKLMALYHPRYLYRKESGQGRFPELKPVVKVKEYVLLETAFETDYDIHDDLALLLTTSGSTGSPKYVRQSYQNVGANAEAIVKYLEIDSRERPILTLPIHYTYGLSVVNSHLLAGAALLLTDKKIMQKEFWSFFAEYGATSISGTPYIYEILNKMGFLHMSLPGLKVMTQAGGKLPETLHKKFAEYAWKNGIRFFVMYGQTEATARMSYLPWESAAAKCGSIGVAIPGGKLTLMDEDNQEIEQTDVPGEIVYYGANVTMGYAEGYGDLVKGDERNGVLFTGDIGIRDTEGFYYIVGRKKRILKMFGKRINLDEVENLLKNEFGLMECCCCGRDDALKMFITDNDGELQRRIREYIVDRMKINAAAVTVQYIDKIPKTESGKVIYAMLQA